MDLDGHLRRRGGGNRGRLGLRRPVRPRLDGGGCRETSEELHCPFRVSFGDWVVPPLLQRRRRRREGALGGHQGNEEEVRQSPSALY